MSLGAKAAIGGSVAFTITIISYVHYKQQYDRKRLREGVFTDMGRQQSKKIQNLKLLQEQIDLTKVLKEKRREEEERQSQNTES